MDATRLRELIDAAISAQSALDAAEAAKEAAHETRDKARERQVKECGNLKAALNGAFVIYGDKVVRIGIGSDGHILIASPLLNVPVLAPPPAPLPEAEPPPAPKANPVPTKAPPLAGGKVPTLGKENK